MNKNLLIVEAGVYGVVANDLFFDTEEWERRLYEMKTPIEKRAPVRLTASSIILMM